MVAHRQEGFVGEMLPAHQPRAEHEAHEGPAHPAVEAAGEGAALAGGLAELEPVGESVDGVAFGQGGAH